MKRKIAVITGSRSEYGLLNPIMQKIRLHPKLKLFTFVTGMHLSAQYGSTVDLISKAGFKIDARIDMLLDGNSSAGMVKSLGIGIYGIAQTLEQIKPEIVLVIGDRIEAFAGAIAATYMNIPVAHIHGGDRGKGDIDERVRHAITKISHLHFVATKLSAQRVIKMGEERKYVYNVGSPAIDSIRKNKLAAGPALEKLVKFNLNSPWLLMVQHPVTTIPESAYLQAKETLEAIRHFKIPTIILYPNADAGGRDIIAAINEYKNQPYLRIYKNLTRDIYLGLLKHAFALIGNSSSGIIEAPFFHVPVVNIGIRQAGRQRSTNIIDVAHKRSDIIKAIKKALFEKKFIRQVNKCKNQYGDGHASERIVKVLSNIKINANLIQKQIIY